MRNDPLVISLVTHAAAGDQGAWDKIIERYSPLVWSICLRYQLDRQDIDDVGQNVWWAASAPCGPAASNGCAVPPTWRPSSTAAPGTPKSTRRGVSAVTNGLEDEALLAALRKAIRSRQAVPPEWVAAAKSAFAWRNIDAELALLTYDSTQGSAVAAPTRAEAASIRALTFSSPRLTIELEVAEDSLLGQVVPAQAAMIEVETRDGAETPAPSDEIGCFSVYPIPVGPFRIRCRTADSTDVLTGWVTL